MAKLLYVGTYGTDDPTRATFPFLMAKGAIDAGHETAVTLMGESLMAFRSTDGRVGLIQSNCPHRWADLFFARNEENGLRCSYHGWKFDVSGACVDMPTETDESTYKTKIKIVSYPVVESGGVCWTTG